MNSRERVIKTLEFNNPDRIPVDLWVLPSARAKYGDDFDRLLDKYERDIVQFNGPLDLSFDPMAYQIGSYIDLWGCKWNNLQSGIVGEVKEPLFSDENTDKIDSYVAPLQAFKEMWSDYNPKLKNMIKTARDDEKFVIGGWVSIFERMQFLRGTENLYCDLAEENDEFMIISEIVFSFYKSYLETWLKSDVDGIAFGDDWGSQRALLISPDLWKKYFRPKYKELFDMVKAAGKYVFFHSDGYIMDIYQDFIDMSVDAINSQIWCMGVENVAERFAGKITFWGEISRQNILPSGSPDDIRDAAEKMKKYLWVNGGGLIGQSEVGSDVPIDNIKAVLTSWRSVNSLLI